MAEKFLQKWFPKKHNVVIATFASYVGIFGLIKIARGNPEPVKPVVVKTSTKKVKEPATTGGYVAPTADNIGSWLDNPSNLIAWEKNLH